MEAQTQGPLPHPPLSPTFLAHGGCVWIAQNRCLAPGGIVPEHTTSSDRGTRPQVTGREGSAARPHLGPSFQDRAAPATPLPVYTVLFCLRFYLFICQRERGREHKQGEQQAEGEAGSPLSREPHVGLDPRTLRS